MQRVDVLRFDELQPERLSDEDSHLSARIGIFRAVIATPAASGSLLVEELLDPVNCERRRRRAFDVGEDLARRVIAQVHRSGPRGVLRSGSSTSYSRARDLGRAPEDLELQYYRRERETVAWQVAPHAPERALLCFNDPVPHIDQASIGSWRPRRSTLRHGK